MDEEHGLSIEERVAALEELLHVALMAIIEKKVDALRRHRARLVLQQQEGSSERSLASCLAQLRVLQGLPHM